MIKKFSSVFRRLFWSYEACARYNGVVIGENCNIQKVSFGSEPYLVKVGDSVQITDGTKIFTHGGGWVLRHIDPTIDFFGKVEIKDNVYVGNNVLIMPGVTIGANVVVAAGSVVTKTIPDGVIVAGNPAKIVSSFNSFEKRMMEKNLKTKKMSPEEKKNHLLSLEEKWFIKK